MNTLSIALVLAGVIVACTATTCYVCASTDGACDDEYAGSADHEVDCSIAGGVAEDGGCSKTKASVRTSGVTVTTTGRTCAKLYDNSNCAQKDRVSATVLGIKSEGWSCSCDGDKCNSGSQLAFSSALIISALAKYLL